MGGERGVDVGVSQEAGGLVDARFVAVNFDDDWDTSLLRLLHRRSFSRDERFVGMAVNAPSIVAWASQAELDQLKSWFYDPQPSPNPGEPALDMRQRAIHRVSADKSEQGDLFQVQAYQTRSTNLPSEIVSTALLTQSLILPLSLPPLVFRTSMTLALIRFVNSLLDPLQKRDKSLPLSVLAVEAGLPTVFVEIRHWGTHENNLPGAEILRDMGIRALEWLYRNFWNKKQEAESVIAGWRQGVIDVNEVVSKAEKDRDSVFEELVVELARIDNYDASRGIFDPLILTFSSRLPSFPTELVDYILQILIATSNGEIYCLINADDRSFDSFEHGAQSGVPRELDIMDHASSLPAKRCKIFSGA